MNNMTKKQRFNVLLVEIGHRFIFIIFEIALLVLQILLLIPMVFSQETYNEYIDIIKLDLLEVE